MGEALAMRPLLLDLFCGAGGAAMGYHRAGFEVVGVDLWPMPRYPFEFIQSDALNALDTLILGGCLEDCRIGGDHCGLRLSEVEAIHASPPCQRYSKMSICRPGLSDAYPDLIEPTRERLELTGLPYVIENVPGAPLRAPVTLCGCQFGCEAQFRDQGTVQLRRKRGFESNFPIPDAGPHHHFAPSVTVAGHGNPTSPKKRTRSLPVYGHSAPGNRPDLRGKGYQQACRDAMGIDWMRREELSESVPPAYTEYVGMALMEYLGLTERQAA